MQRCVLYLNFTYILQNQGNQSLPVFADFNFRQYILLLQRQYPTHYLRYHKQIYRRQ